MDEAQLTIQIESAPQNVRVVRLTGELNEATRPLLESLIDEEIKAGRIRLVLDGSALNLITSQGVASLIQLTLRLKKQQGDVRLASMNAMLSNLINLLRLDRLIGVYPDVPAAVASYEQDVWM